MIIRKIKGRGERISIPVSQATKEKWETSHRVLREKGYEVNFDGIVLRIIKSIETEVKKSGEVA